MNGLVWFIGKQQNNKTFYVAECDDDNHVVMWTLNKKEAISFKTEKSVNKFINKHLNGRIDIILVQAPPN